MPDPSAVISKVLPFCVPSDSEEQGIAKTAQEAKALVEEYVARLEDVSEVVFGGSFAKGTWLPHHADIDIFVKIKTSVGLNEFEEMGRRIGSEALKKYGPRLRYSDHPYVEAFVNKVRVNVVPCYDVEQGEWKSAADRSPFHTQYINSHFDDKKRKQARLLKKFFKSAGIYGAEISTEGFSGYVSEVLVVKYCSFENILRAAADDWQQSQIIAVHDYNLDLVKTFSSPLIIIDPVDSRRNLGTAISPESVAKFILASRAFIEHPSVEFFNGGGGGGGEEADKKNHILSSGKLLLSNLLVVEFSHQKKSPDIIWGQLKRSVNSIAKQLELADFEVLRFSCVTDERNSAVLVFLLEAINLPPYTTRKGPEIFRRNDTAAFLSKRKTKPLAIWVDGEMRITMLIERKFTDASKFIKSLLINEQGKNGISKDLIVDKIQIYSAGDKKIIKGLAKEAIGEIVSTQYLIFR